jgi:type 1 glutamine amidotransferase/predicted Ser/Thr protein kinase
MAITIQCPNPQCRAAATVTEALNGRKVKCKRCGTPFVVQLTLEGQAADTKGSRPAAGADDSFPSLPAEFGRYRVLQLLGKGGMGAVYLAEDTQLGRRVALKLPSFDASASPQRVERFLREARSAAALHHPNICTLYDAGREAGRPFLTMAYVEGHSLAEALEKGRPLPPRQAVELVRKIAVALRHAHEKGIVHRDLKPANVMVTAAGEPVIMDFGLAKRLSDSDAHEARLTHEGAVLGTPTYMAPEQVRGETQGIGPHTDVYALGVMLFEMLTGQAPYLGPVTAVLGQILAAPVPSARQVRPDVDARLEAICRRAMAKEPRDRFASMAAFAEALDGYLGLAPPPLPRPSEPRFDFDTQETPRVVRHGRRTKRRRSRAPLWIGLGVGAGVLLLAVVLTLVWRWSAGGARPSVTKPEETARAPASGPSAVKILPTEPPAEGGWVPLFNGRDLAGWQVDGGDKAAWYVDGGELVCQGKGALRQGWLLHEREFSDFVLRLEYRMTGEVVSGVGVRRQPGEPFLKVYIVSDQQRNGAVQKFDHRTGGLWWPVDGKPEGGYFRPYRPAKLQPPGWWDRMEIDAHGSLLRVSVNGEETLRADLDGVDPSVRTIPAARRASGRIGLQCHTGTVRFRSVEVRQHAPAARPTGSEKPHVVFVLGDQEYKPEESLVPIVRELEDKHALRCTMVHLKDQETTGLEVLQRADLAVLDFKLQQLPQDQLNCLLSYVNAGKPVVAFRSTTHAFRYPPESALARWNDDFGLQLLGQKWLFHYGTNSSTDVSVIPQVRHHPVLEGVEKNFHCRSWLYHVLPLPEGVTPLLLGRPVGAVREGLDRDANPVAWVWEPKGGRVFYTSLGHPDDFQLEPMRRLTINAVLWALNRVVAPAAGR